MKNAIEVSDSALCDSFDTKHDDSPIDIEFGMEEDFFLNQNDKQVLCRCTVCKTNSEGVCIRKHLSVGDVNDMAKCESFEKDNRGKSIFPFDRAIYFFIGFIDETRYIAIV